MKHISCGRCGLTIVPGPGGAKPYGLCKVCMVALRYKEQRRFQRATTAWIALAKLNKLR